MPYWPNIQNHLVAEGLDDKLTVAPACGEPDEKAVYMQECKNYICRECLKDGEYKEILDYIKPL